MGQFDPHFTPVGHPGWSGTVIGQQWRKHKVQAGGYYISSLVGVQTTGVQMAGPSCWPPGNEPLLGLKVISVYGLFALHKADDVMVVDLETT